MNKPPTGLGATVAKTTGSDLAFYFERKKQDLTHGLRTLSLRIIAIQSISGILEGFV